MADEKDSKWQCYIIPALPTKQSLGYCASTMYYAELIREDATTPAIPAQRPHTK